jgi:uncharacterized protein YeaO (DUF488 family)
MIVTKRAYEPAAASDGFRVLIDRPWPRGVSKLKARLDAWEKDIALSRELREWYGHDPAKWPEFRRRYTRELRAPAARAILDAMVRRGPRDTRVCFEGGGHQRCRGARAIAQAPLAVASASLGGDREASRRP